MSVNLQFKCKDIWFILGLLSCSVQGRMKTHMADNPSNTDPIPSDAITNFNYIQNGGFEQPKLTDKNYGFFHGSQVTGWRDTANDQMEIGKGSSYSSVWADSGQITELSTTNKQAKVTQDITLKKGQYYLVFDFATKADTDLKNGKFSVWWNGKQAFSFVAADKDRRRKVIEVTGVQGKNTVSFNSESPKDAVSGIDLDNVILYAKIQTNDDLQGKFCRQYLGLPSK